MAEGTRLKDLQQQVQGIQEQLQSADETQTQKLNDFKQDIFSLLDRFHENLLLQIPPRGVSNSPPITQNTFGISGPPPLQSEVPLAVDSPRFRPLKLEFPRFAAGDPTDWLFAVDRYCVYYQISDADRLLLVSMHLDKPAAR